MKIQCPAPDCQYKTPEMEAQLAMQLLMLHNANVHESATRQGCKPEALKRPLATLDMTETAWEGFQISMATIQMAYRSDRSAIILIISASALIFAL